MPRWVVERTLAWIIRHRRTVWDYERLPARHEAVEMPRELAAAYPDRHRPTRSGFSQTRLIAWVGLQRLKLRVMR